MMHVMLPENIIFVGIAVNSTLAIWYIRSVILGSTRPNIVSWVLWTIAPLTGFFLSLKAGVGLVSSGAFVAGFFPLLTVIVLLLKKDSYWRISFFDVLCGFLSIFSLIVYFLTLNLSASIFFAVLSDTLASVPTWAKTWKFPHSESVSTYAGGIFHNSISLLTITKSVALPNFSLTPSPPPAAAARAS